MLANELHEAICELPIIDVHSHLRRDGMCARDAGGVMFYHMLQYPLRAAGMDERALWPARGSKADPPYKASLPYWPAVANTSFGWGLRTILRELYDFDGPITAKSLPRLRQAFDQKAAEGDWGEQIRTEANVVRILSSQTDVAPLAAGQNDKGVRFTVESHPSGGGSELLTWPQRLERIAGPDGGPIATAAQLRRRVAEFYEQFDWSDKHALVSWVSSQADFRPADDGAIDALLGDCAAGRDLGPEASRVLEAALLRAVCQAVRGKTAVFQICYGTQYLTPDGAHPVARAAPQFASGFGRLAGEFPDIHFNILSGFEIDEPVWCSLCLGYANVSLAGYWWGMFYPSVMHRAWHRRLDVVPTSRLCGFFSDGWCIDWAYARVRMTQRVLAGVLAEKIERGFYTTDQAVRVAREILFETPRRLFLPAEEIAG